MNVENQKNIFIFLAVGILAAIVVAKNIAFLLIVNNEEFNRILLTIISMLPISVIFTAYVYYSVTGEKKHVYIGLFSAIAMGCLSFLTEI